MGSPSNFRRFPLMGVWLVDLNDVVVLPIFLDLQL